MGFVQRYTMKYVYDDAHVLELFLTCLLKVKLLLDSESELLVLRLGLDGGPEGLEGKFATRILIWPLLE